MWAKCTTRIARVKDLIKVGRNPIEFCECDIENIVVEDVDDIKKARGIRMYMAADRELERVCNIDT